ncbi:MAG: AmmeMemoRadiSam system protein B [Thermodesulfobacteriota bacterium]
MRTPAVAFQFYPGVASELKAAVKGFLKEPVEKREAMGLIVPHAGYIYSGKVAGSVYSEVTIPDTVILLGPNHTGLGDRVSIMDSGIWEMPFGSIPIDESLASLILRGSGLISSDSLAHLREHSLEVQLPFISYINPDVRIIPITVMLLDYSSCVEIGNALARAIKDYSERVLIVVSSDMDHYEDHNITKKKDRMAIDKIIQLDPEAMYDEVRDMDISMCGMVPAAIGLVACKELGAKEAKLIDYATSGDVSGDYDQVVGYAGIVIR